MLDTRKMLEAIAEAKNSMEEIKEGQQPYLLVHNDNIPSIKKALGNDIDRIENIGFNSYVYLKMPTKKPVKKKEKFTTDKSNGKKTPKKLPFKEVEAPEIETDYDFLADMYIEEASKVYDELVAEEQIKKIEGYLRNGVSFIVGLIVALIYYTVL